MDKKYINFYKKFILQTKTVSDDRIKRNISGELTNVNIDI